MKSFCSENKHAENIIVVGTEPNKRKSGTNFVTEDEGKQMAERISAVTYIECSNDQASYTSLDIIKV